MAQVVSNYVASLLPVPARMSSYQPPAEGFVGNLTQAQEAKLRALWAIGYKFVEICEAQDSFVDAVTLEDKFVPPAMRPGYAQERKKRRKLKKGCTHTLNNDNNDDTNNNNKKYPGLAHELLSLLPPDHRSLDKQARDMVDALDYWTPHMFRIVILHTVKQEHPDELVLRFLRHSRWDIIKACKMMGRTIYWRTMEAAVDDDILRLGEGGAAEDEKNGQGYARHMGAEFMKNIRSGKGFLHGNDRLGRPINYIRIRLHRRGDDSVECLERYIVYLLEMARLSLRHPVETGTVFLDMSGFRMANFDLSPLRFILKCAEQYYPESIGLIIIHKAPYGSKALWRLIRLWVNANIASKVKFTRSTRELTKYIDASNILVEHGGQDEWQYEYEEPSADENFKMQNTITRNCLLLERQILAEQFEAVTKEWVMNAQRTERAAEVARRRDAVCADLTANFWELDPFVRARSLYDRRGCLCATGNLQYHPPKSELRRATVDCGGGECARRHSLSTAASSSAAQSSILARSALGHSPASSVGSSAGPRCSISATGSGGSGTLVACSILGSPVKKDHVREGRDIGVRDGSSCYSD